MKKILSVLCACAFMQIASAEVKDINGVKVDCEGTNCRIGDIQFDDGENHVNPTQFGVPRGCLSLCTSVMPEGMKGSSSWTTYCPYA